MYILNYIGSKYKLSNKIISSILKKKNSEEQFIDLFSGTGIISYKLQNYFDKIIINDWEEYSYIIAQAITTKYTSDIEKEIENINIELEKISEDINSDDLISINYTILNQRKFFTIKNTKKADYIRKYIEKLEERKKNFILASLIVCLDKLANSTSVYGAFLKEFKKSSLKDLYLYPIHTDTKINEDSAEIYNYNAPDMIDNITNKNKSIVYIDPPYCSRQYSKNYAPLNFICLYDNNVEIYGKAGLLKDSKISNFCLKKKAYKEFQNLLRKCFPIPKIFISYNNEGILSKESILELLTEENCKIRLYIMKYNKYNSHKNKNKKNTLEYLFYINKNKRYSYEELEI